ncbi:unnamed protein product [Adineta steineri]|uniref:Uncharacterized protein n=1 Tax=Adineta steineri TaxID=433720 RepID=A0A815TES2_9BILA|nr:unnamed protein product [Adineta steineri]
MVDTFEFCQPSVSSNTGKVPGNDWSQFISCRSTLLSSIPASDSAITQNLQSNDAAFRNTGGAPRISNNQRPISTIVDNSRNDHQQPPANYNTQQAPNSDTTARSIGTALRNTGGAPRILNNQRPMSTIMDNNRNDHQQPSASGNAQQAPNSETTARAIGTAFRNTGGAPRALNNQRPASVVVNNSENRQPVTRDHGPQGQNSAAASSTDNRVLRDVAIETISTEPGSRTTVESRGRVRIRDFCIAISSEVILDEGISKVVMWDLEDELRKHKK